MSPLRISSIVLSLILLVAAAERAVADWPRFLGPNDSATSAETGIPTTFSDTENVAWKTKLPGPGASSPIVVGDRIFLTCYSGYGLDRLEPGEIDSLLLHVVCLDRASGEILWDKMVQPRLPEKAYADCLDLHGYASATPVSDGEAVYVFFGRSGVWKFDLDGNRKWAYSVGSGVHKLGWGSGASPILADDLLIVNASIESESIRALNKETGLERWRKDGVCESWCTPRLVTTAAGDVELVAAGQGKAFGLDPKTGEELWNCPIATGEGDYVAASIAAEGDVVFVSSSPRGETIAVRTGGRGDVSKSHLLWELDSSPEVPTAVASGGKLFWIADSGRPAVYDAKTGEELGRGRISGMGKVYASPLLVEGRLYLLNLKGRLVILSADDEMEEVADNELTDIGRTNASPVVDGGQLLLRGDEYIYCIGK